MIRKSWSSRACLKESFQTRAGSELQKNTVKAEKTAKDDAKDSEKVKKDTDKTTKQLEKETKRLTKQLKKDDVLYII